MENSFELPQSNEEFLLAKCTKCGKFVELHNYTAVPEAFVCQLCRLQENGTIRKIVEQMERAEERRLTEEGEN